MAVRITEQVSPEAWDRLVADSPLANIFHERRYLDCFRHSSRSVPFSVFFEKGDTLLGGVIGVQNRMMGPRLTGLMSRSVVYGGLLLSNEMTPRNVERDLGDMIAQYDAHVGRGTLFTEIRNLTDPTDLILPLTAHGYRFEPHLNYLIDLKAGEEVVWSNVARAVRRKKRRAAEEITVVEATTPEQFDAFYDLVRTTYARVHVPLFEREVFRRAFDTLREPGWLRVTLGIREGRAVASRAALTYRGVVFDWFAGTNAEGDAHDASTLMAWDMIEWGCRNGYELFDFGGAGDPNQKYGVREFKSRFHGRLVNFGRFTRIYSRPRYLLSSTGYNVVRRLLF